MNYLSAEQLSKNFGDTPLFQDLTFGISQGQKVALVGHNGCGKSTLLKILAGKIEPDKGKVVLRKEITSGYLSQEPELEDHHTIKEEIFNQQNETLDTISAYEDAVNQNANPEKLQELIEKIDSLNAWDMEYQIHEILGKLGIHNLDNKISELSGGQKKRVALAKTLIESPDFLILDEPTNHLDVEIIEWLENYLTNSSITLLLITHDRYFLENICNHIFELDGGKLFTYPGNFSYFLEKKEERRVQRQTEIDKAKNLMRKELDWIRRQPKARGTKAKYRVEAFDKLAEKASEKIGAKKMEVGLDAKRQGGKILEISKLSKSFGELKIVKDFSYVFKKMDKIGIVGKNGVGKSSFLKIISGLDLEYSGEIDKGQTTKIGFFQQDKFDFTDEHRVIDVIKEVAEVIRLSDGSELTASQILGQFLFPPPVQYQNTSYLSGGEKKRLQLLRTLVGNPNFLILDEPTNDLDIYTLAVLEDFLMGFNGCLMIVSHDRYFMDRLVEHCFVFEGEGKIMDFPGNYSQYRDYAEAKEQEEKQSEKPPAPKPEKKLKEKTKLSFKEKSEYESLEKEIEELEARKEELVSSMNTEPDHEKLQKLSEEFNQLSELLEVKINRWMELAEYAD